MSRIKKWLNHFEDILESKLRVYVHKRRRIVLTNNFANNLGVHFDSRNAFCDLVFNIIEVIDVILCHLVEKS